MAETTCDLRIVPREEAYVLLGEQLDHILVGIEDRITMMATIAALVHHGFGHLWTGFYRVAERDRLLRVGPYQGTLGCLEIPFGQGVCGTAALRRQTVVVHDVQTFAGHIACDARARSEIVVPVHDGTGDLIAVFDVDSDRVGAFDQRDADGLARLVSRFIHLTGDRDAPR